MLGLWPGGKELLGKKHRPGWPSSWRLRPNSARCGGPIGRPAGHSCKERTPSSEVQTVGPPTPWNGSCLMVFAQKVLAPGPGTRPKATFRKCPFQSAMGGSLFFLPPALREVMIIFLPGLCALCDRSYFRWCKFGAALKLRPFSVSARAVRFTESCLSR